MIKRTLMPYLLRDAGYYPVVTLTGPRQSGKTTLVKSCFPDHTYVSLEEPENRTLAKEDPRGFLNRFGRRVIIDEVQRVPDLLSYVQSQVDQDVRPGQYILTGSQNFLLMEKVSQTLAGRCGVLHLLPFSRSELEGQPAPNLGKPVQIFANESTRLACWQLLRTGFYPRIHDRQIPPEIWLADYLRTYVERDVRALVNIGDLETFERFLRLCAGRTGHILNCSGLACDCGIAVDTVRRWLSILKTSFIVFLLKPHHRNFNKRLIKSPKLYFYDTGLACYLLGIRTDEQLQSHPARGALFENLILSEAVKSYLHQRREPPLFFWRDQTGHELDLLVDEAGELYPVEIKSGSTFHPALLDGLVWWNRTTGNPAAHATLVYSGDRRFTHHGINIRPWFAI